ncbi:homeobox-containing protein 1 [Willisornis vidua]|uniref:Homeobox-containing protein 1 n=1 Tax=Willisornis vidua TaxID=1566151 RepID=A0ABQ9DT01_9PASS|nr:homeobox-containing protein 1 [Willisornis vidua]
MSHYTDEPRFTIEQIDLLQRLRRTGMTRHEILHALETLDRLDQEHSDKFGRRSGYGGGSYGNSTTNNVAASSSTATAATQTQHSAMSPSPSNSYDTSPQPCTTNQNGRDSHDRLAAFNGKMSPTRYPLANSLAQRSYSFEASEEDLDIDDKVEELMRSLQPVQILLQIPPACPDPSPCLSSLPRSLCRALLPSSRSTLPPNLVSSAEKDYGKPLARVAQKGGGCPILGNIQAQVGWGSEQPDVAEDVPAHGRSLD